MHAASPLRYLAASFLSFLMLVTVHGQTPGTGAVSGVVYDPANRAVAHAVVLAVNESTHISRSVPTTAEGLFRVPLLPPGAYSVTVTVLVCHQYLTFHPGDGKRDNFNQRCLGHRPSGGNRAGGGQRADS